LKQIKSSNTTKLSVKAKHWSQVTICKKFSQTQNDGNKFHKTRWSVKNHCYAVPDKTQMRKKKLKRYLM